MKKILLFLFTVLLALTAFVRIRYGGGEPYPDFSTAPILPDTSLEAIVAYPEPVGNVAVSADGRVFFTVHPESRPRGNKLLEFVNGASVPFPDGASQSRLFDTVLGISVDRFNRLWTIDHGNHGLREARLMAFDIATGELVHDQRFDSDIAPAGSYLQDLRISADGRTVIIADASFWRRTPALIVYDVATASARRILQGHVSVSAENYLIRNKNHEMSYGGGIVSLRGGVDGIALDEQWLYFAALSGSRLYRIGIEDLRDAQLPDSQLAARVESYSAKPLSDGLSIDTDGNVLVTDIEHGAIVIIGPDREPRTLIESERIRWPDSLSFGPDSWLYLADSALAEVILKSTEHIRDNGPYIIYRFKPVTAGFPGQ